MFSIKEQLSAFHERIYKIWFGLLFLLSFLFKNYFSSSPLLGYVLWSLRDVSRKHAWFRSFFVFLFLLFPYLSVVWPGHLSLPLPTSFFFSLLLLYKKCPSHMEVSVENQSSKNKIY